MCVPALRAPQRDAHTGANNACAIVSSFQRLSHLWVAFRLLTCLFLNYVEVKKEKVSTETNLLWGRAMPFLSGGCGPDNERGLLLVAAPGHLEISPGVGGPGERGREHTRPKRAGWTWCWKHPPLKRLEFSQHFPGKFWKVPTFFSPYVFSFYSSWFHCEESCLAQSCPSFNTEYTF